MKSMRIKYNPFPSILTSGMVGWRINRVVFNESTTFYYFISEKGNRAQFILKQKKKKKNREREKCIWKLLYHLNQITTTTCYLPTKHTVLYTSICLDQNRAFFAEVVQILPARDGGGRQQQQTTDGRSLQIFQVRHRSNLAERRTVVLKGKPNGEMGGAEEQSRRRLEKTRKEKGEARNRCDTANLSVSGLDLSCWWRSEWHDGGGWPDEDGYWFLMV